MTPARTNAAHLQSPPAPARVFGVENRAARLAAIPLFVALTAAGASMAFPLPGTPVPVTLQTLFVLLAGVVLGPWMGASAMAAYLALGVVGAPVFAAGGAGFAWLLGPTGGYLVAFPAAAFVAGWVTARGLGWGRVIAAFALGTAIILVGGTTQLALVSGTDFATAWSLGASPFLVGAALKGGAGAWLTRVTVGSRRRS